MIEMTDGATQSQLVVPGIRCLARIGVGDDEGGAPQGVVVALALTFDALPAGVRSDDLADTIDYARLVEVVSSVTGARRYRLLESLAKAIHERLLPLLGAAVRLWVEVTKARSPIDILERSAWFGLGGFPGASVLATRQPHAVAPVPMPVRRAREADRPRLQRLVGASVRGLGSGWYTARQIAAALEGEIWGVDAEVIRDGGCYVIEEEGEGEIIATGAWSRRETAFGGDGAPNRSARFLDPATESARIRAFFVHPRHARRGLATAILNECERQAAAAGFRAAALIATLPGEAFYRARGYTGAERLSVPLPGDGDIEFVRMQKSLATRPHFVGILNVTEDSFSDGGRFLDADAAIAHGERLLAHGADWIDVGAESSNPQGQPVPAEAQIARFAPVLRHLAAAGARLSIDTHRPEVMRAALDLGARMINDITGLTDPEAVRLLAARQEPVVIMFARNDAARASAAERPTAGLIAEATSFFAARLAALEAAGISRERVIIDPGMGFFLGGTPRPSLLMLKELRALSCFGRPLYVSTSRKSFVGAVVGGRPPAERAFGTIATELWAATQRADFIRTHDVRAIRDAWTLWKAVEQA